MLPNFLIIGAARSGTTSLYSALQTHPDVYLPQNKRPEPHFFLKQEEWAKGLPYYEQRFFADWQGQHAVGEASTSYLYGPEVPRRVANTLPGVRLLCLLRNPIERAFSGYWHTVASGLETLSFDDALAQEDARKRTLEGTPLGEIAPFAYVERGLYHQQLARWFEVFDRSRFDIILLDELVASPPAILAGIARFLGIDPVAISQTHLQKANVSVPGDAVMSRDCYRSLAERVRDDVTALGKMLNRDLNHWLDAPGAPPLAP